MARFIVVEDARLRPVELDKGLAARRVPPGTPPRRHTANREHEGEGDPTGKDSLLDVVEGEVAPNLLQAGDGVASVDRHEDVRGRDHQQKGQDSLIKEGHDRVHGTAIRHIGEFGRREHVRGLR